MKYDAGNPPTARMAAVRSRAAPPQNPKLSDVTGSMSETRQFAAASTPYQRVLSAAPRLFTLSGSSASTISDVHAAASTSLSATVMSAASQSGAATASSLSSARNRVLTSGSAAPDWLAALMT